MARDTGHKGPLLPGVSADANSGRNMDQLRIFLESAKLDAPEYDYLDMLIAAGTTIMRQPALHGRYRCSTSLG
jgi:hypothetical protein